MRHYQKRLILHKTNRIRREHAGRETGGKAKIARLVMSGIARAWFQKGFAARLERSEFVPVENGGRSSAALAGNGLRPFVDPAEIGLPIRSARLRLLSRDCILRGPAHGR